MSEAYILEYLAQFLNYIISVDDSLVSTSDPKLYYFIAGVGGLYFGFLLSILLDIQFYWTIDTLQQKLCDCVAYIGAKLWSIQNNKQSVAQIIEEIAQEHTRTRKCNNILTALCSTEFTDDDLADKDVVD